MQTIEQIGAGVLLERTVLKERLATLRGLLRILPGEERQRGLNIFEGFYGLRGERPQNLGTVSSINNISLKDAHATIEGIWASLVKINAPYKSESHLLKELRYIRGLEGDECVLGVSIPSLERRQDVTAILSEKLKDGQLDLDFPPIAGDDFVGTVFLNTMRALRANPKDVGYPVSQGHKRQHEVWRITAKIIVTIHGVNPEELKWHPLLPKSEAAELARSCPQGKYGNGSLLRLHRMCSEVWETKNRP